MLDTCCRRMRRTPEPLALQGKGASLHWDGVVCHAKRHASPSAKGVCAAKRRPCVCRRCTGLNVKRDRISLDSQRLVQNHIRVLRHILQHPHCHSIHIRGMLHRKLHGYAPGQHTDSNRGLSPRDWPASVVGCTLWAIDVA